MKSVIIQGSSRPYGDSYKVSQHFQANFNIDHIDLYNKNITHFDYEHNNRDDDFLDLMREIINKYDKIFFVTPVYWYSMSGILKVFFDRITDLLTIEKELGRQLRGKSMGVISVSNDDDCIDSFGKVFELSADYLGMQYLGHKHTWIQNSDLTEVSKQRIEEILKF